MLKEIAGLGFEYVELSHGIRITLVPGILKALSEGVIKVSSTHNFCPLPAGMVHPSPNLFEPSAREGRGHEHEQWLRHSKRTLDFARQVGARAVVFHLGSVSFFWFNPGKRLREYARANPGADLRQDPAYRKLLMNGAARLQKRKRPYWAQVKRSIAQLMPHAVERGLTLGFENRERFEELPIDSEFPELFAAFPESQHAGYWHDTGHAELKERMGVITQRQLLEQSADRLVGFHLHDVSGHGMDHQAVGKGKIDFGMVSQFWRPHHLLIIELSPRAVTQDVIDSKKRIEELLAGLKDPIPAAR